MAATMVVRHVVVCGRVAVLDEEPDGLAGHERSGRSCRLGPCSACSLASARLG